MLKFVIMLLCVLYFSRQVWNAPIIKASGVQWTEPKGNGKGNLTLIMIPQNNSCTNDTDMLIAVKSDYQVVSQDTQLLNLVINEYQNETLNGTCTTKRNQNVKTYAPKPVYKSDMINQCGEQNYTVSYSSPDMNRNQCNVPKDIANQGQIPQAYQSADDYNRNGAKSAVNFNQNSKSSDSISYTDFLKHMNSVGEVEQHSELDSVQGSNNVNFYEAEKKTPVQVNEQSNANAGNQNNLVGKEYPGGAVNLFKFLSAAQIKETTPSFTQNTHDVFKFLRVTEPSPVLPSSTPEFSTLYMYKSSKVTDRSRITSSNTIVSKNSNSRLFSDSEMNIFKLLNISEPNIGNKLKKMNEGSVVTNGSPHNVDSNKHLSYEVDNLISKLKQEPIKGERNLRPDLLTGNQAEELVALEEGDFDIKAKLSKGDYSASASDEDFLKKQLNLSNSNEIGEFKAEGNGNSEGNAGTLTTCYVVKVSADGFTANSQQETLIPSGGGENTSSMVYSEAKDTLPDSTTYYNLEGNLDDHTINTEKGTFTQTSTFIPVGGGENTETAVYNNEAEVTTVLPSVTILFPSSAASAVSAVSAASAACRTSIIYICNEQTTGVYEQISEKVEEKIHEMAENLATASKAAIEVPQKKSTLEPQKNCSSLFKTKQLSGLVTNNPIIQPDQVAQEKSVFPLVESAMFLGNSNEIPKGNNVPIFLNTSSSDYMMDVFLSNHDEKLAKFRANPSDLTVNEEVVEYIPPKIDRVINNRKNKISIKNSNSMNNEQVLHPGDVLKVRFAGKQIIMEQNPSYRSEKGNKDCDSTPKPQNHRTTEPQSDEMEPDEEENKVSKAKTPKTHKPTMTTQITSKHPDRTSHMKEKESHTKKYSVTSPQIPTRQSEIETQSHKSGSIIKGPSKTKTTTEQPEVAESVYSQINTQVPSQDDKTSQTKKGQIHVTECKHFDYDEKSKQKVNIPGESVKEIVIQIIRNTKSPGKLDTKPHHDNGEANADEIYFQNNKIKRPTLAKFSLEQIKPGGYEMEMSNEENNQQQNIKYWDPESLENGDQLGTIDKYGVYPYLDKKSNLLNNFDVGKENNVYVMPVIHDSNEVNKAIFKSSDKNEKALSYSDLKLLVHDNNVINGA